MLFLRSHFVNKIGWSALRQVHAYPQRVEWWRVPIEDDLRKCAVF